ncbi:ADP-ribosylglycohydrolase family protein [Streptomyces sp. NPDC002889]|uniref:ADP-ribosylglycohydrolase family protein n=1 Tax=Streptomyces sp. NPDC002889 TaxID=3364669 RepID=UPI00367D1894
MSLRLTWVQPEDLIGHELRQADEDGRDVSRIRARWLGAGGSPAPPGAGASPAPPPPELRALALELLDELAGLPSPLAEDEPTGLTAILETCRTTSRPEVPPPAPSPGPPRAPGDYGPRTPPPAHRGAQARGAGPHPPPEPAHTSQAGAPPRPAPNPAPSRVAPRPRGPGAPDSGSRGPATPVGENALHAAWLGRAVGCLLGKPVEKLPLHAIRGLARATGNWPLATWFTAKGLPPELAAAHPWNRRSATTSLAENIDGMPEDDDLNYPLLNLLLLQRHGRAFTTEDVARLWLDELPAGRTFTAERVAYRNLLGGLEPPLTATHRNPFREWIGAAIRADVHGWTNPGDPVAAAAQAYRDAALTHTANGVYAAMFVAAAIARAAGGGADVHESIAAGLSVVPPRSRLARAVRFGVEAACEEADFDDAVDRIHAAYGSCHWVHAVPNAALLAAALTHADGDFSGSVCRAVSGGLDTDSNGATAGSLAGLLAGHPGALPDRWTAPLKNRLATSVAGFDGIGFDTLARLTHQEALRP